MQEKNHWIFASKIKLSLRIFKSICIVIFLIQYSSKLKYDETADIKVINALDANKRGNFI